jgi:hypothetical protein
MAMAKTKTKTKTAERTPRLDRVRYVESPTKKDGNPFFALRVPGPLLRAFKSHAKGKRTTATALVREYMSKATGIELDEDGAE